MMQYVFKPAYREAHHIIIENDQYLHYEIQGLFSQWCMADFRINPCGIIKIHDILSHEVHDWLTAHDMRPCERMDSSKCEIMFPRKEDAMLFRLRWA